MKAAAIILSIIGLIVAGLGVVCFVFHTNMAEDVELFSDMLLLSDDIEAGEVIELLQEFGYEFEPLSLLAYRLGPLPLIVGAVLLIAGIVLLVVSSKKPGNAGKAGDMPLRPGFMKCPSCGNQIPLGTTFCVECGHSFVKSEPPKPAEVKPAVQPAPEPKKPVSDFVQCLECGHVNKGTDSFCTNCGTALKGNNVAPVAAEPKEEPKTVIPEEPEMPEETAIVIEEPAEIIPEEPAVEIPEEPVPVIPQEPVAEIPVEPVEVIAEETAVVIPEIAVEEPAAEVSGFRISSSLNKDDGAKAAAPGRKYLKKAGDL